MWMLMQEMQYRQLQFAYRKIPATYLRQEWRLLAWNQSNLDDCNALKFDRAQSVWAWILHRWKLLLECHQWDPVEFWNGIFAFAQPRFFQFFSLRFLFDYDRSTEKLNMEGMVMALRILLAATAIIAHDKDESLCSSNIRWISRVSADFPLPGPPKIRMHGGGGGRHCWPFAFQIETSSR